MCGAGGAGVPGVAAAGCTFAAGAELEWCMKLESYTQNFLVSQLVSGRSFQTEIEFEFLDFLI